MKRIIKSLSLTLALVVLLSVSVAAATAQSVPYETYSRKETQSGVKTVISPAVYIPDMTVEGMGTIADIIQTSDGRVYMLDSKNGRVVVLKEDLTRERVVDTFTLDGKASPLNQPAGLYVNEDGTWYIADTENQRLLLCRPSGEIIKVIGAPTGDLIPKDLKYFPMKVMRDRKGFLYLLNRGSYYGAMVFDSDGTFLSFYGANAVKTDILSTLSRTLQRMFTNNERLSVSTQKLPFQFLDFCLDSEDFLYTVSPTTAGQIRKLSPAGKNILQPYTDASADSYNWGEKQSYVDNTRHVLTQNMAAVAEYNGLIYALDSAYGRVYVYDQNAHLLCAFGGGLSAGSQIGTFRAAKDLAVLSDGRLLIADSEKLNVTVFTLTDYGKQLTAASSLTQQGEYEQAAPLWRQVLAQNSDCQMAYRGLAREAFSQGDYEATKEYAYLGLDQEMYAKAYDQSTQETFSQNFWWIFLLAVAVVLGISYLLAISSKRQIHWVKNLRWRVALRYTMHPFESARGVKDNGQGSVLIAFVLMMLWYVLTILSKQYGGFMYQLPGASGVDSVFTLLGTAGVVLLFTIVNWAVSTLVEGKGRAKEIFTVVCYSLMPLLVYQLVYLVGSHVLVPSTTNVMGLLATLSWLVCIVLMLIGLMIVHDFSFWKAILCGLLTLLGMALVFFVVFMIIMLVQNLAGYVVSLFQEIFLR